MIALFMSSIGTEHKKILMKRLICPESTTLLCSGGMKDGLKSILTK
jgi:hypothetical protein